MGKKNCRREKNEKNAPPWKRWFFFVGGPWFLGLLDLRLCWRKNIFFLDWRLLLVKWTKVAHTAFKDTFKIFRIFHCQTADVWWSMGYISPHPGDVCLKLFTNSSIFVNFFYKLPIYLKYEYNDLRYQVGDSFKLPVKQ